MARLYQKINNEAVPLGGGGGGSVAIDNVTITENSDDEIQVATTLISKINQLNNVAADMGKVLTANGDGTAEWDDVLVPIDYETITKNSDGELQVSSVPYDNTESGLEADNVQDAIDEVNTKKISGFYDSSKSVLTPFSGSPAQWIAHDASWTATENCVLVNVGLNKLAGMAIHIDGEYLFVINNPSNDETYWAMIPFFIEKGQTVRLQTTQATTYVANIQAIPIK